jgi:hypothetical protein
LLVVAIVVIGATLFLGGVAYGRMRWGTVSHGLGRMKENIHSNTINQPGGAQTLYDYGMMGTGMMNGGLMSGGMMNNGVVGGGWTIMGS